jgi:DNA-nicking Smr family endonuclease
VTRKPKIRSGSVPAGSTRTGLEALRGVKLGTTAKASPKRVVSSLKAKSPSSLTEDEHDVWDYVAQSVTPVDAKHHVPLFDHLVEPPESIAKARRQSKSVPVSTAPATVPPAGHTAKRQPPAELSDFEPRKAKRIGRGHIEIDARIDLHGDRQDDAHQRLRAFLLNCFHAGQRTVLVITGKGRDTDAHGTSDIGYERRERGVLKRNVPRWLAEPEMRAIVVSYTSAHVRHGGEGALYVQLRRRR